MTSLPSLRQGRPADNIDGALRDFFQAEIPAPWPQAMVPNESPAHRIRSSHARWFQRHGRLAVAAAIALMLLGYLALADSFPQKIGGNGELTPATPPIGLTPRRVPLPGGKQAILWDEMIPGKQGEQPRFIVNVHPVPEAKPRR